MDTPPTLLGKVVTLRPLTPTDAPELFAATPPDTFRFFLSWPDAWTLDAFSAWLLKHITSPRAHVLGVVENASGRLVGSTSILDIDEKHRAVEIGATWYAPRVRGSAVNPETKLLLLAHAFGTLGCARVTLKCDARNLHSRSAIAKIGAAFEGIIRRHRVQADGFVRDTAMFGVIAEDWPRVRGILEERVKAISDGRMGASGKDATGSPPVAGALGSPGQCFVSFDKALLDVDVIHEFLASCYWSPGIHRSRVERGIEHSLCFGVYDPAIPRAGGLPGLVGFARVVTDRASFAYLCDVFVLESHRGRGLSRMLMDAVVSHPSLRGLRRFCLFTRDAHALYAKYGFQPTPEPARYMERLDREGFKQA